MHGIGFVEVSSFKSDFLLSFHCYFVLLCVWKRSTIVSKVNFVQLNVQNVMFLKYQTGMLLKCISNRYTDFTHSCTSVVKSTNATGSLSPVLISFIVLAKLNPNE